jgi:hypothetical protein
MDAQYIFQSLGAFLVESADKYREKLPGSILMVIIYTFLFWNTDVVYHKQGEAV